MDSLNLTLVQGYPSRSSEVGGLQRDRFVRLAKSHVKWYGLHPNQDRPAGSVSFLQGDSAKLNSAFSRIARASGLYTDTNLMHLITGHSQKVGEGCMGVDLCL